jgi:hypothetical protein
MVCIPPLSELRTERSTSLALDAVFEREDLNGFFRYETDFLFQRRSQKVPGASGSGSLRPKVLKFLVEVNNKLGFETQPFFQPSELIMRHANERVPIPLPLRPLLS